MVKTKLINISDGLEESVKIAADTLISQGIIVFPTETVYGIGCRLTDIRAMEDIFILKNRSYDKPLSAYISHPEQVHLIADNVNDTFEKLADAFLPGPLALVLEAKSGLPNHVTDQGRSISVRYPDNEFLLELINRIGLLAGTSENISGEATGTSFNDSVVPFIGKIGAAFQDDEHIGGVESTIISLSSKIPQLLRAGAIGIERIEDVLGYKLNK